MTVPDSLAPLVQDINTIKKEGQTEKNASISVVMELCKRLGWSTGTSIKPEYPVAGKRVDLALVLAGKPVCFFEVKRLGEKKLEVGIGRASQAVSYAMHPDACCPVAVLTNGAQYVLFNVLGSGTFTDRIVGQFDLLDWQEDSQEVLDFLKKDNLSLISQFLGRAFGS